MTEYIRVTREKSCSSPETWAQTINDVYRVGFLGNLTKIGEYVRKYHAFEKETFCTFKLKDQEYAALSSDYEMVDFYRLPQWEKVELTVGSIKSLHGMCPVDIWVPSYKVSKASYKMGEEVNNFECYHPLAPTDLPTIDTQYHPFAFVRGCYWGDDSSWKIAVIDLTELSHGIVHYKLDKDGQMIYLESFSKDDRLFDCVDMDCIDSSGDGKLSGNVQLAETQRFNVNSWK